MRRARWWLIVKDIDISWNQRHLVVIIVENLPVEISWYHYHLAIATRQRVIPVHHTRICCKNASIRCTIFIPKLPKSCICILCKANYIKNCF